MVHVSGLLRSTMLPLVLHLIVSNARHRSSASSLKVPRLSTILRHTAMLSSRSRTVTTSADVPRGAPNGAIGPAAIRRLSLPGHHPARLGLGAPQDATGAERCAVSVGPVDRMFATPPDSPGQCEPGLSDDRPRDPRLCYCPELSPRATRSSSS